MSAEDRFVAGARAHAEFQFGPAHVNDAHAQIHRALLELRRTPDHGIAFLFGLLKSSDQSIATWAALFLLPHREDAAKDALRRISASGIPRISFNANMTLREWEAGRLKID